jgi:hypothetical protein
MPPKKVIRLLSTPFDDDDDNKRRTLQRIAPNDDDFTPRQLNLLTKLVVRLQNQS